MPEQKQMPSLETSEAAAPPAWITFPFFERLALAGGAGTVKSLRTTAQELEALAGTASASDKARAALALKAYRRALQIIEAAMEPARKDE